MTLSGSPTFTRNDGDTIDFQWNTGSPGGGVPADAFSARWTRTITFNEGVYQFSTNSDDGSRVFVDGQLIVNSWQDQALTLTTRQQADERRPPYRRRRVLRARRRRGDAVRLRIPPRSRRLRHRAHRHRLRNRHRLRLRARWPHLHRPEGRHHPHLQERRAARHALLHHLPREQLSRPRPDRPHARPELRDERLRLRRPTPTTRTRSLRRSPTRRTRR